MNDYALLALVWTLTLAVGALGGTIVGWGLTRPGKKEADETQLGLDVAYDLGYRDGYQDGGDDQICSYTALPNGEA